MNRHPAHAGGVETSDYLAMLRRMIRAAGLRAADGDPADFAGLVELAGALDDAIALAAIGQHEAGQSWGELGAAVGITRQAARQRWGGR